MWRRTRPGSSNQVKGGGTYIRSGSPAIDVSRSLQTRLEHARAPTLDEWNNTRTARATSSERPPRERATETENSNTKQQFEEPSPRRFRVGCHFPSERKSMSRGTDRSFSEVTLMVASNPVSCDLFVVLSPHLFRTASINSDLL